MRGFIVCYFVKIPEGVFLLPSATKRHWVSSRGGGYVHFVVWGLLHRRFVGWAPGWLLTCEAARWPTKCVFPLAWRGCPPLNLPARSQSETQAPSYSLDPLNTCPLLLQCAFGSEVSRKPHMCMEAVMERLSRKTWTLTKSMDSESV